jgi:hypothetical protein
MAVKKSPRVVVITGASGGIGRASARLFAQQGDQVALLARGSTGLEAAAPGGPTGPIPEERLYARTGTSARIDRRLPNARLIQALGARYVLQGLAGAIVRRRWMPAADATVDLVHAASMVTPTHFSPAHRRLATTGAAAPFLFAVADPACHRPSHARARIRKPPPATPPRPELRSSHRREAAPMSSTTGAASTSNVPDIHAWEPPSAPHDLAVMGGATNRKQST